MNSSEFECDEDKAAANFAKHGIRFEQAVGVFSDPFALEFLDDRHDYGEDRYILIGMTQGRVLVVVYTPREQSARLISAREAQPQERRRYHEDNS